MEKVFHFDSPRGRYACDAAIVWCFDNRFELAFRKFLKRLGVEFTDPIKIAGGAKSLSSPGKESEREFVLDQIRTSMRLHNTKRVILMLHSDCGAFGGLEAFGGNESDEAEFMRKELHKAANALLQAIPGLRVDAYFVDFDGVWERKVQPA